jgi:hypothetical protein
MTTAEWVAAVSGLVSAILSVLAIADPGSVLSRPDMQVALGAVFASAVPILVAVWAYLHHQTAVVATTTAAVPPKAP